jgi:hypothetical protein
VDKLQSNLHHSSSVLPHKVALLEDAVEDIQQHYTRLDDTVQGMVAPTDPIHLLTPPVRTPPAVVVPSSQQPLMPAAGPSTVVASLPVGARVELRLLREDMDDLQ